jgi:hypothetical protein
MLQPGSRDLRNSVIASAIYGARRGAVRLSRDYVNACLRRHNLSPVCEAEALAVGLQPTPSPAEVERGLAREWEHSSILREEFGDDFEAFVAFRKHDVAGDITICGKTPA